MSYPRITIENAVFTVLKRKMDPALKKLLDELPLEDPDKAWATVWTGWTQGRHRVAVGEWSQVSFGEWFGPPMRVTEVRFWYEIAGKRDFFYLALDVGSAAMLYPHDQLDARMCVPA